MLAEISAGLGSLKAAYDITKGLDSAKTQAAINDVKIPLQQHILDAQQALASANDAQTEASRRIEELEKEIGHLKDWSAEKERYELADTGQGSLAYRRREGAEPAEPAHWICPQCYEDGKKSILKNETLPVGRAETLACHRCGFDVVTEGVRHEQRRLLFRAVLFPAANGLSAACAAY
jgi:hypothetical protein